MQEASLWWPQRPRSKRMFQGYKIRMLIWHHMEAMDGQWGAIPENAKRTEIADLRGSASKFAADMEEIRNFMQARTSKS